MHWFSSETGIGGVLGLSGELAGLSFEVGGSRAFVSDTSGNVGIMTTVQAGAGTVFGASTAGGVTFGGSDYSSLNAYAGWSVWGSASGGADLGGSVTVSNNYSGTSVTATVGAAEGLSGAAGASYSYVTPICK